MGSLFSKGPSQKIVYVPSGNSRIYTGELVKRFDGRFVRNTPASKYLSQDNANTIHVHLEGALQRGIPITQWAHEVKSTYFDKENLKNMMLVAVEAGNGSADSVVAAHVKFDPVIEVSLDDNENMALILMIISCQRSNTPLKLFVRNATSLSKFDRITPYLGYMKNITLIDERSKQPIYRLANETKAKDSLVEAIMTLLTMKTEKERKEYLIKLNF